MLNRTVIIDFFSGLLPLKFLKQIFFNISILGISLIVVLLMSEGLTRVIFYKSMDFDMEMWKYATQVKVASEDPRVGHEHLPNQKVVLMGVELTTNSWGLRDDEIPLKKPSNTYRIGIIGDSRRPVA